MASLSMDELHAAMQAMMVNKTSTIRAAEVVINKYLRSPVSIPMLLVLLSSNPDINVRARSDAVTFVSTRTPPCHDSHLIVMAWGSAVGRAAACVFAVPSALCLTHVRLSFADPAHGGAIPADEDQHALDSTVYRGPERCEAGAAAGALTVQLWPAQCHGCRCCVYSNSSRE
jgi:hypothetical protein